MKFLSSLSAKAQAALAAALTGVLVYVNNHFALGIDNTALVTLGTAIVAAIAVIDHGEPADLQPTAVASNNAAIDAALAGLAALKKPIVVAFLVCGLFLAGCATSPQAATVAPKGELGQGRTTASAAMYKSAATSDAPSSLAPEGQAVGAQVTVPFALWNSATQAWAIPLDKDGKPYLVTATAVRDFTYVVAGTVTNSATVSGTASGTQTQAGTTGQTATPTNTVSPTTNLTVPAAGGAVIPK